METSPKFKLVVASLLKLLPDGTSKAKYLKDVLGANRTLGFEQKDLSKVKKALNQRRFPAR